MSESTAVNAYVFLATVENPTSVHQWLIPDERAIESLLLRLEQMSEFTEKFFEVENPPRSQSARA